MTDVFSDKNYEEFYNAIDDFLFVLDEQVNIIDVNQTVLKRLGYLKQEFIGKSFLSIHPVERREEVGRIFGEMLEGKTETCSVPIIAKDGIQIPVETKISTGTWNGKQVLFGVTKDISKLKLSEERYSKLFSLNPSACGLSGLDDHKYIDVNQSFYDLLGFSRDEIIGKTPYDLQIFTSEMAESILSQQDSTGKIVNVEVDLHTKNGEVRHVLMSAENIFIQDKKYRYTIFSDITEIKKIEATLKSRESLLIGLSRSTDCILSEKVITKKNITDALKTLGFATSVDRVYIFENIQTTNLSRGTLSQRYEWSRENVEPQIDNPNLQNILWDDVAPRWYDTFVKGNYISGNVADFPESERKSLDPQKILSLLAIPISVSNKFWGFIGFDSCSSPRKWDDSEVALLRSVANSFAVVIERMRAEQFVFETKWRMESIIKGTNIGTWEWNVQTGEAIFNERWAEIVGYSIGELSPISIKTWEMLAHPDDLNKSESILHKHFTGELPYYEFESRMKHKNGNWIWVLDRGSVITRTTDKNPLMMFGTHVDITERKIAEKVAHEQTETTKMLNKYLVGRELKMIELKNEIEVLKKKN
jgi:PAS domain S-box-containing protein